MLTLRRLYYLLKPAIPRGMQLSLRSAVARHKRCAMGNVWPILESASAKPDKFVGWPDNKEFAFILTHDVDTQRGHDRSLDLMNLEMKNGFRSSFNFVPERYTVDPVVREQLSANGFEVGVHGLTHEGEMYDSYKIFSARARRINHYLSEWKSVGFRSPSMFHQLDWIGDLAIEYDASTFDTDPFEPQADGVGTIYPFMVRRRSGNGYVELPYTLAQDFTLFVLLGETTSDVWKDKLDWIVRNRGMALVNVHPDYCRTGSGAPGREEYSCYLYEEFLAHVRRRYEGRFYHALPRDLARFWSQNHRNERVYDSTNV